jgi:cation diffusion facilitator family transporter
MDKAQRIAIISMVVSGLLALMKISAGIFGQSNSVLADGFESAADVFASGLVYVALLVAARPPDGNHPYGHGRAETLAGFVIGFFLLDAGLLIAWHGFFGAGDVVEPPHAWAIWTLAISIVAKAGLVAVKMRQAKQIGSEALKADAANDAIDIISGFTALIALSLTLWQPERFIRADHYGGFLVGLIVIVTSVRVMRDASLNLMDTMPDGAAMQAIRQAALEVQNVRGVEKCFARKTGLKYHVDLHLEVDPEISVRDSHDIAERVRNHIRKQLSWVQDVLVHVEPFPGAQATQTTS